MHVKERIHDEMRESSDKYTVQDKRTQVRNCRRKILETEQLTQTLIIFCNYTISLNLQQYSA